MQDVVVIGAGKIGATVAGLLASTGRYQVTLADRSHGVSLRPGNDPVNPIFAAEKASGGQPLWQIYITPL